MLQYVMWVSSLSDFVMFIYQSQKVSWFWKILTEKNVKWSLCCFYGYADTGWYSQQFREFKWMENYDNLI